MAQWQRVALAACAAAAMTVPSAGMAQDAGWYIGGSIGNSQVDIDSAGFSTFLASEGLGNTISGSDDKDSGFKLFAGYRFNRHLALEGGYVDLGSFSVSARVASLDGVAIVPQTVTGTVETKDGLNLAAVGILPLGGGGFSLFGKAGLYSIKSTTRIAGPGGAISESDRKEDLLVGLGASYDFARNFGVRVEWERFMDVGTESNEGDIDLISIGLVYRFK